MQVLPHAGPRLRIEYPLSGRDRYRPKYVDLNQVDENQKPKTLFQSPGGFRQKDDAARAVRQFEDALLELRPEFRPRIVDKPVLSKGRFALAVLIGAALATGVFLVLGAF